MELVSYKYMNIIVPNIRNSLSLKTIADLMFISMVSPPVHRCNSRTKQSSGSDRAIRMQIQWLLQPLQ
jgi:hypothetical protein